MADLRLKRIQIRNWMTVKEADLRFPETGLVLVLGSNLAAKGKLQSVGAGKTALGEALARNLVGAEGRFSYLNNYVPDNEKDNTYVRIEADLLSKPLVVESGVKCAELSKTGECLRFTYDSKTPIQRKTPQQTRDELCRTLGVTPELANWTIFLDGDKLKFNKMPQEETVNILMMALNQPPWTYYFELAKKKMTAANEQLAASTQKLNAGKSRVENLSRLMKQAQEDHDFSQAEYNRQVKELGHKLDELRNVYNSEYERGTIEQAEMTSIKNQLALLEEQHSANNHALAAKRGLVQDSLAIIDSKWLAAANLETKCASQLDLADDELTKLKRVPKNCPTCGKPWDKAHGEEEIAKVESKKFQAQSEYYLAKKDYAVVDAQRKALQRHIREIEDKMAKTGHTEETRTLAQSYSDKEESVRELTARRIQRATAIARLEKGVDATFVNNSISVLKERQRFLEEARTELETAASDMALDQETVKVVRYWYKAYGPTGIPNMVLSDAIGPLNRVAQRISNLMTGGTLNVTYSTTRELGTGESRAKLVTVVENRIGSKRLEGSSKGEAGLTNLIIAENLNEIGQVSSRVGFRWFDEITGGQDGVVRRSIFAYLKEMAQRLGILIFVVDHHAEAASYADYVLVAEKSTSGITRYFWR